MLNRGEIFTFWINFIAFVAPMCVECNDLQPVFLLFPDSP